MQLLYREGCKKCCFSFVKKTWQLSKYPAEIHKHFAVNSSLCGFEVFAGQNKLDNSILISAHSQELKVCFNCRKTSTIVQKNKEMKAADRLLFLQFLPPPSQFLSFPAAVRKNKMFSRQSGSFVRKSTPLNEQTFLTGITKVSTENTRGFTRIQIFWMLESYLWGCS